VRRKTLTALIVLISSIAVAPPLLAIDTLSYWLTKTAGISKAYSCTASSFNVSASFIRQYRGGPNDWPCAGLDVYFNTKGQGSGMWSSESYYIDGNYLKIIQELAIASPQDSTRAFRDDLTGWKGVVTVPLTFNSGWSYNHLPYHEETWVSQHNVCHDSVQTQNDVGSGTRIEMYAGPTLVRYLQDRRGTSPALTWNDVQTIERRDFWGNGYQESYWYGKWYNPTTRLWEGVGLIKWEQRLNGVLQYSTEWHYLVDCAARIYCSSCPP